MRLPDGLDDEVALREYIDGIELGSLAGYIEQLDPDDQLRVLHLLQHGPRPSAQEIDEILASFYGDAGAS